MHQVLMTMAYKHRTQRRGKVHPWFQFHLRDCVKILVKFDIRITIYTERLLLVRKGLI